MECLNLRCFLIQAALRDDRPRDVWVAVWPGLTRLTLDGADAASGGTMKMTQLRSMHRDLLAIVGSLAMVVAAGCSSDTTASVATSVCKSGVQWTGGNEGNAEMNPGQDCVACHAKEGEGPTFAIAGTVFSSIQEADNCYGASGAEVIITGSDGKEFVLAANAAGNFSLDKSASAELKIPYTAKVRVGTKENAMVTPQVAGSCNSCHTKNGANAAPGRVMTP